MIRRPPRSTLFPTRRSSDLFAIRGEKTDGNRFVFDAVERGARAIASELPRPWNPQWGVMYANELAHGIVAPKDVPDNVEWIQVADARKALAMVAAIFNRRPAQALKLVGVTGTNGKTTTTYLIDSIVRAAGHEPGLFGTITYRTPRSSPMSTPTPPEP